jgi:hypothetical protein
LEPEAVCLKREQIPNIDYSTGAAHPWFKREQYERPWLGLTQVNSLIRKELGPLHDRNYVRTFICSEQDDYVKSSTFDKSVGIFHFRNFGI